MVIETEKLRPINQEGTIFLDEAGELYYLQIEPYLTLIKMNEVKDKIE